MSAVRLVFLKRDGGLTPEVLVARPGRGVPVHRVLVVPGEAVLSRRLSVPGKSPAQMRAAALSILGPDLAAPPEQCVAGLGDERAGGRLVCVADRTQVETWRATAIAQGFAPDIIIADHALLTPGDGGEMVTARREGVILAAGPDFAFSAEPDLARLVLAGRATADRDIEQEALAWARRGVTASAPDLLSALPATAAPDEERKRSSRTLLAGLVALLLGVSAPWIHAWRIDQAGKSMRRETFEAARAALPAGSVISNPRAQLAAALDGYRASPGMMLLVADVLDGAALATLADIQKLDAPAPGEVRVSLSAARVEDLEPLRQHLTTRTLAFEETTSPGADGRLNIDLVVRGAP